jgi:hypothetical protein
MAYFHDMSVTRAKENPRRNPGVVKITNNFIIINSSEDQVRSHRFWGERYHRPL